MRVLVGSLAISLALVFLALSGRYELTSSSGESGGGMFRIDRLSGEVTQCVYSSLDVAGRLRLVCGEVPEYVTKPVAVAPSGPSMFQVMHPEEYAKQEAEKRRLLAEVDAMIAKQGAKTRNNNPP